MTNDRTRRPVDPWKRAEALFKPAASKDPAAPPKRSAPPAARELVSLRIDRDVLEHFQEAGPDWQDRINQALRHASGVGAGEGLPPDRLNSSNDV